MKTGSSGIRSNTTFKSSNSSDKRSHGINSSYLSSGSNSNCGSIYASGNSSNINSIEVVVIVVVAVVVVVTVAQ